MYKRQFGLILVIFLLNMNILLFLVITAGNPVTNMENLSRFRSNIPISFENKTPSQVKSTNLVEQPLPPPPEKTTSKVFPPSFSIQGENTTTLLNLTGAIDSVYFESNIWENQLGSDPIVLSTPASYQNGYIISNDTLFPFFSGDPDELKDELEVVNNSLFIRIGNNGYGTTYTVPEDENDPNEDISGGISAGWQIGFSIIDDFDLIQVSFRWRFDAQDLAFDIYNKSLPWYLNIDTSDDFQEIRCRVKHPDSDQSSFWLGNPGNEENPNRTVFYRVGPIVEKDEEWFQFNTSFYLPPTDDLTLELGAYLNTRERFDEYFDVWFDDILIQGINNISDNQAPQPIDFGLRRTSDVSIWEFWAELAEGRWETPITNTTVFFYNQSGILTNRSLDLITSSMDAAGYNQTYWQFLERFNFGENISYKFIIYDEAGNFKETELIKNRTIGDYEAPEIMSTLNIFDSNFVRQLGNGTIIIRIDTNDWGNATDKVILYYTLEDDFLQSYEMIPNGTYYQAKLAVDYGRRLNFEIFLNDTAKNYRKYSGFSVISNYDITPPTVNFDVNASTSEEGRTLVNVNAKDPYGEIDRV
ncbi:MAG: hypothetical protein ACFFDT_12480, partial [Candidatus Hodarchaeota archaeon]